MFMDSEVIEKLYDVRGICNAVIGRDVDSAIRLFDEQLSFLAIRSACDIELMSVFLNSLDRGIYNHILQAFGNALSICSLNKCCHENFQTIGSCRCYGCFSCAGKEIIENYFKIVPFQSCKGNAYIEQAKEYIGNNLSEPLTLKGVAEKVFLSDTYLSHLFRELAGTTFSSFVLQQRIDKAKKLLEATELSVSEIAGQCGFSQSNYFSTVFKKSTAHTPREYRLAFRKHASNRH
ncbi:MAG: AraC family transcriptional regulator [Oscillospiraceae bacterium]|nr:AraC family transcriptional regulator [Oscillospiraceae bacterium]